MEYKKKLIEVALPLEAINAESAREKSIRFGHPSTLHLWWARRPLATSRAVIWSSLVDDPSSHPDQFPTEDEQKKERTRLFGLLSRLVSWENVNDATVLNEAKREISKSIGDNLPAFLDPFAGGGAIPLEAQRLGLEAHAHDLNPIAVMINKAMIEIPPKFCNHRPVNPEINASFSGNSWTGYSGLAEDIRYYGEWMKRKALNRIGHLYPKVMLDGSKKESTVIAWIWVRTVKCPNPACGCEMPLMRSFFLSSKKGDETYLEPIYRGDHFEFSIAKGKIKDEGTINRKGAKCLHCGASVDFPYIRQEGQNGRMIPRLVAIVAEDNGKRVFLPANEEHIAAAKVNRPDQYPDAPIPKNPRDFKTPNYGLANFADLFTNRQLIALTTFSELVHEAKEQVEKDAVQSGIFNDHIGLKDNGIGAKAYSEAVAVYLAFGISRMANSNNSCCRWTVNKTQVIPVFARQAIPMVWDYAENNVFNNAAGDISIALDNVSKAVEKLPNTQTSGFVKQFDAQSDAGFVDIMISTDPPYYDNIGYADLSDFFYIWMRETLKNIYPNIFRTMLVPKAEELVATPYRFDGDADAAKDFFEDGMFNTCVQLYKYARKDIPVTIYYAFKQSDTDEEAQTASSGWETMLSAIIRAGFAITGTWPMRTEMANRSIASGTNALASSIVLVCRKRSDTAGSVTRREFINALHREMKPALEALQSANIAPVDLAQSAIGPGIGVFSRYKSVVEADGSPMSVRAALQIINQELDAFYNEQEGELDSKSRFCVDIFNQYAFNTMKFGDADILARAKNTSVQALVDEGVMEASKGTVRLKTREEIPERIDGNEDCCWKITQQLARAMDKGGIKEAAAVVSQLKGYIAENAKQLAYRLYTICERKNWAAEGYAYNNLIVAWSDIQNEAARLQAETPVQMNMFDNV